MERKISDINVVRNLENVVALINPRKVFQIKTLLPEIVREKGRVLVPVLLVKPDLTDPEWVKVLGEHSIPEAKWPELLVLVQGHRRWGSLAYIHANPSEFDGAVCENAKTCPATVIEGVTCKRARDLALDERGRANLMKFEVVTEAFRRFWNDESYQDVCVLMAHMLMGLLSNGEAKYREILAIDDGRERNKKLVSTLRNVVDQHLFSAHLLGPAMVKQVIAFFKKRVDKQELDKDAGERLLLEAKLDVLRELRSVFTKSKDSGWQPIVNLNIDDVTGDVVIEGGNKEVNELLVKEIQKFRNPESFKDEKQSLPNKTERENVAASTRSKVGQAYAQFFSGETPEKRAELDEAAYYNEQRAETLGGLLNVLCPELRNLAAETLTARNMEGLKAAWLDLNAKLANAVAVVTEVAEVAEAVTGKKAKK